MMSKYPTLSKAPIVEAVFDIRIKIPEDLKVEQLEPLYDIISGQYPNKETHRKGEFKLELKPGSQSFSTAETINGYVFTSSDKKQIVQTRMDGFTFSRLQPYETWESFKTEARNLWGTYKKKITSPEIIRIALRYINKFEVPFPVQDFGDYLVAPPTVPNSLPQGVSSFLTRIVIDDPKIGASAIITQVLDQVTNPKFLPIILDIDVFIQKSKGFGEKEMWEAFEKLRDFKNKIFFESITEKAKELFE